MPDSKYAKVLGPLREIKPTDRTREPQKMAAKKPKKSFLARVYDSVSRPLPRAQGTQNRNAKKQMSEALKGY